MGRQTILLHAVFLTNHYTTEQCAHILYKSKAACQALITIALAAWLNRAQRKYVHSKSVLLTDYVYVLYIMGTCLPTIFLVNEY